MNTPREKEEMTEWLRKVLAGEPEDIGDFFELWTSGNQSPPATEESKSADTAKEMTSDEKQIAAKFLRMKIQFNLTMLMVLLQQYEEQVLTLNHFILDNPSVCFKENQHLIGVINTMAGYSKTLMEDLTKRVVPAVTLADIQHYSKQCAELQQLIESTLGQAISILSNNINGYIQNQIASDPIESTLTIK